MIAMIYDQVAGVECRVAGGRSVQLTLSSSIGRSRPTSLGQVNSVNSMRTAELRAVSFRLQVSCEKQ